jgi:glycyl-tRNA synthetase
MDALGTPFCVTVDYQTKEDGTVTIRYRDTMQQERVSIEQIKSIIQKEL